MNISQQIHARRIANRLMHTFKLRCARCKKVHTKTYRIKKIIKTDTWFHRYDSALLKSFYCQCGHNMEFHIVGTKLLSSEQYRHFDETGEY